MHGISRYYKFNPRTNELFIIRNAIEQDKIKYPFLSNELDKFYKFIGVYLEEYIIDDIIEKLDTINDKIMEMRDNKIKEIMKENDIPWFCAYEYFYRGLSKGMNYTEFSKVRILDPKYCSGDLYTSFRDSICKKK